MRSVILFFVLAVLTLVDCGCDHSFNPKEEFQERYVLQCFIQPGTVTAVLAKTYDVDGFDPSTNTIDPAISGAEVVLTINQKPFYLQGTLRVNPDTSRYQAKQWVYSKVISAVAPDAEVILTAKLPNGKTLSARTIAPNNRTFASNYDFTAGLTTPHTLQPGMPNWVIDWDNPDDVEVHIFVPRLSITYTKTVGENEITGTVTVPSRFISTPGGTIPYYPSLTTQKQCTFEFAALDSAMAQISAGDSVKSLYAVHSATLEVIEYDTPLSKYFSSINGSLDQYSIRTDESVYSNVSGGIGIVGTYTTNWVTYFFDQRYVQRFGYRYR